MKKKLLGVLLILGLLVNGCGGNTQSSQSESSSSVGKITWEGLEEQTVVRGDNIDLLEGIKAFDSVDGDISNKIIIKDDGGFSSEYIGGYTVTYEVTNSSGITSTATKEFGVMVAHNVFNGEFDYNFGWTFDIPGGAGSSKVVNGEMVLTITDPGNAWWSVQFYQLNTYFVKGETYHLTFDARSPQGHSISAGFEEVNNNNRMMQNGIQVMKLTNEMQTYSFYYTADVNCSNVKTVLYVGHQLPTDAIRDGEEHQVIIDNINVAKVEMPSEDDQPTMRGVGSVQVISGNHEFDKLEGVKVYDMDAEEIEFEVVGEIPTSVKSEIAYIVSYRATDAEGNFRFVNRRVQFILPRTNPYETINGSFDDGFTGWIREINQVDGTGKATYSEDLENGTVTINVTDASNAGHHIQLFQNTPKFTEGETYQLIIKLKSSVSRKVKIEMTNPAVDYLDLTDPLTVTLTSDYQIFTIEYTADQDYESVKVALLLGNIDGKQPNNSSITIDEFRIIKIS